MKFISLQHISIEDPGTFKDFLIEDGHSITTIQLDEGDSIPNNLDEFDAVSYTHLTLPTICSV